VELQSFGSFRMQAQKLLFGHGAVRDGQGLVVHLETGIDERDGHARRGKARLQRGADCGPARGTLFTLQQRNEHIDGRDALHDAQGLEARKSRCQPLRVRQHREHLLAVREGEHFNAVGFEPHALG
jgi:hypothetical protein